MDSEVARNEYFALRDATTRRRSRAENIADALVAAKLRLAELERAGATGQRTELQRRVERLTRLYAKAAAAVERCARAQHEAWVRYHDGYLDYLTGKGG